MHMPPPSAEETAQAIELGHEPSTVSVKGVGWFFIVFFACAAIIHVIVWVMYREMVKYEEKQSVQRSALTTYHLQPPEPRLQPTRGLHERTEWEDLALMHGRENLEFVNRGWINRESGDFRVPDDLIAKIGTGAPVASTPGPTSNPASGGTGAGMPR
jgi:hypothetical protein